MSEGIVFQVDTQRILRLLSKEIYDSPLALLRENVQNAYDAVRMRFGSDGTLREGGRIDLSVGGKEVRISDNGLGMNEATLRQNFWNAGSSGKRTDAARRAGVVGTFGIGAMANFGVCSRLTVETRLDGSEEVLLSSLDRDKIEIGKNCIEFSPVASEREVGTTVTALLDSDSNISEEQAAQYLTQYVGALPVPVYLNGKCISTRSLMDLLSTGGRTFVKLETRTMKAGLFSADFEVQVDPNGQVLVLVSDVRMSGQPVDGQVALLQAGGQLMGLRSRFGLAPIPTAGSYQFGGFADLAFLQPTAGREALSRECVEQVGQLVSLAERAASEVLAGNPLADRNNAFLTWVVAHARYELAGKVMVTVQPDSVECVLEKLKELVGDRVVHYYQGSDRTIVATFSSESARLITLAQANPRRRVQLHYVTSILAIPEVPDSAQVVRRYSGTSLSVAEASILFRIASIVRDDYLVPDVEVQFAEISHGVTVLAACEKEQLKIVIARESTLLPPLVECYDKAYPHFTQFVKDFVRVHVYPRMQQFVPSSTRDGVDALRRLLQRNRELYRYDETDRGDFEGVLGEFLAGAAMPELLRTALTAARTQNQRVSREQVGTVESVVPDVVLSPVGVSSKPADLAAAPPILREDVDSDLRILTTGQTYPQLNNFTVLLGLSDRLMRSEGDFLRSPHTTRILWGGHRVIYIFTEVTGRLSLYYDIELREPIRNANAGGGMFATTTLITKRRIFVPVPEAIASEFQVGIGPKEFYVRYDVIGSDVGDQPAQT